MKRKDIKLDGLTLALYFLFILFGWLNIYAASAKNPDLSIFNLDYNYGKQFLWIIVAVVIGLIVLVLDTKFTELMSYFIYGVTVALLLLTLLLARNVNGARAWIDIGPFKLQAAEFAKIGTALALARFMSRHNFSLKKRSHQLILLGLTVVPVILIMLQPDTGSALVFLGFFLMLFREGLSPVVFVSGILAIVFSVMALIMDKYIVIGIILVLTALVYFLYYRRRQLMAHLLFAAVFCGLTLSVNFGVSHILKPHQQVRIQAMLNPNSDPLGTGWNITQSKIAIGSGGFAGKGFLKGTQTKFDFVPQQDTDFIFCTIGEEYGWLGSTTLMLLFFLLLFRLVYMAEKCRTRYGRIYGYSVAAIFFMHIAINVGMAIGVAPVIGIPLPFFSYGGSSLIAFTVLLFLLMNHYANRNNVLGTDRLT